MTIVLDTRCNLSSTEVIEESNLEISIFRKMSKTMRKMELTSCLKTDARYFSLILFELSSPVTDQMYMYNQVVKNMPTPIAKRYKALCPESVLSRA